MTQMFTLEEFGLILPREAVLMAKTSFSLYQQALLIVPRTHHEVFEIEERLLMNADLGIVLDKDRFDLPTNLISIQVVESASEPRRMKLDNSGAWFDFVQKNADDPRALKQVNLRIDKIHQFLQKEELVAVAQASSTIPAADVDEVEVDLEVEKTRQIEMTITDEERADHFKRLAYLKERFEKSAPVVLNDGSRDSTFLDVQAAVRERGATLNFDPYKSALRALSERLSK